MKVKTYDQLKKAIDEGEKLIELENSISSPNSLTLKRGVTIRSTEEKVFLSFINSEGLGLTSDNTVANLAIQTNPSKRAIFIDSSYKELGKITLKDLTVTGLVQLLTRGENEKLLIDIDSLDIISADSRFFPERPMKYGVNVYQGALTIYNFNPSEESRIDVRAENISLGRENAPVIGSGVFISGFNDTSGPVYIEKLSTNEIHSNGMIPSGQPNLITGAIFIVYGAFAKEIESKGLVKTYGTNDMVLDVWGTVDKWISKGKVVSLGSSGIGFVNFGKVKEFKSEGPILTYGLGARGFNQYDGTIEKAYFKSIETFGNGSIGMQFSKPVGTISIEDYVKTKGSVGETLVKGEIKTLKADAISVLEGGEIKDLDVKGDLLVEGEDVVAYHVNGGKVGNFSISGQIRAENEKSQAVVIENDGKSDLSSIEGYL
ncbi:MAG: hypothetical protein Q4E50_00780 [Tissierellia bacterium]|nr:hypothetical protein [Tissierellia bacterium]